METSSSSAVTRSVAMVKSSCSRWGETEEIFGEVADDLISISLISKSTVTAHHQSCFRYLPFDLSDGFAADMSGDGSVVVFSATANNLVANDTTR